MVNPKLAFLKKMQVDIPMHIEYINIDEAYDMSLTLLVLKTRKNKIYSRQWLEKWDDEVIALVGQVRFNVYNKVHQCEKTLPFLVK